MAVHGFLFSVITLQIPYRIMALKHHPKCNAFFKFNLNTDRKRFWLGVVEGMDNVTMNEV